MGANIRGDVIEVIGANLQAQLSLRVDVLENIPVPESAYNADRNQYNALEILKKMQNMHRLEKEKVLGVVNVDIFIPILTHVFGEAQLGQSCAVISLWRISRNNDGSNSPLPLYFERAAKLAVHELVHTFNIKHCQDEDCIMKYLPNLKALDDQDLIFCKYCSLDLEEHILGG